MTGVEGSVKGLPEEMSARCRRWVKYLSTLPPEEFAPLVEEADAAEAALDREQYAADILAFGRRYVPHWFSDPWPSFAGQVQSALLGDENVLVEWWRGGGKSKICVDLDTLHAVLYGRTRGDLILSGTGVSAGKRLMAIRDELEQNARIRHDFGDQVGKPWHEDFIRLKNGVTVETKGSREQLRGDRPHRIKFDDSERDDRQDSDVRTAAARESYRKWVEEQVIPALDVAGGRMFAVFTPMHTRSFWHLKARSVERGAGGAWRLQSYSILDGLGRSRWPERFTDAVIAKIRASISTDAWMQEYMLRPQSETAALIRPEWIKWYGEADDEFPDAPAHSQFHKVLSIDSAISKSQSANHSAIAMSLRAVNGPAKGNVFFPEVIQGKWTIMEQLGHLYKMWDAYRPDLLYLPESVLERVLKELLPNYFAQRGVSYLPIRTFREDTDKRRKAMGVVSMIERGRVYFHRRYARAAADELCAFTGLGDESDDMTDAVVSNLKAQSEVLYADEQSDFSDLEAPPEFMSETPGLGRYMQ